MDFPHLKTEREEYGSSPGNGTTLPGLSREPLATEGEATTGPDDVNPYDRAELEREVPIADDFDRGPPALNIRLPEIEWP